MKLFDEFQRTDFAFASYVDTEFSQLNNSARRSRECARDLLEDWFSRYPASAQAELRGRFRASDAAQYESAFFEMFLHELLLRLGCSLELHPQVPNSSYSPDFRVKSPNGISSYVEAVVATGKSPAEIAAEKRENQVYDALNRHVDASDFYLLLSLRGRPETPPPGRQMANLVNKHLANLNVDEAAKTLESEGLGALPEWHFDHAGWRVSFKPLPKSPGARGKRGVRPIGARSTEIQWIDDITPIRDAISRKAGRYGEFDLPYIVAVNSLCGSDMTDIVQALFGTERTTILQEVESGEIVDIVPSRARDGVWMGPQGPKNTRVSGVFITVNLNVWRLGVASSCLYHNPWAQSPYDSILTRFNQAKVLNGEMKWIQGDSVGRILDLPSVWPAEDE